MNDVFIEQIVKRQNSPISRLKTAGIIIAAVVVNIAVLLFGILRMIFPFTLAATCWFLWIYVRDQGVEYEYSFTNGGLDVDCIAGRRKRQRLASVRVRQLELLAPASPEFSREYQSQSIRSVIDASISDKSEGRWFMRYTDEAGIETLVFFNPSDRLLEAMGRLLGRRFKGELPPSSGSDAQ